MRWMAGLLCAGLALAEGTNTKPKAEDYPVHGPASDVALGAEFMVHSFGRGEALYIVKDCLVVEVAMFPMAGGKLEIRHNQFALRINGKKAVLTAQQPEMVATSLKHPDWSVGPTLETGASVNGRGASIGGPPINRNPFPGAPPVDRMPRAPRAPDAENRSGLDRPEETRPDELVLETALPEGSHRGPVSGFVYFPWKGKTKSIKQLELLYSEATLRLR